jgi:hypothetical protein
MMRQQKLLTGRKSSAATGRAHSFNVPTRFLSTPVAKKRKGKGLKVKRGKEDRLSMMTQAVFLFPLTFPPSPFLLTLFPS